MSFITVIIPILNAMPYLTEALASLEGQTFKDFEVCLWDNGSTDGSMEEARRWIPARLKGRLVTGSPLPLHQCLARMVEESKTEFVARMDGDDISLPFRFEQQYGKINNCKNIVGIGGQLSLIAENGSKLGIDLAYPNAFPNVLSRMLFSSPLPHAAMLMRRNAILACGNYKRSKPVEDFDLWFRLAKIGELKNLDNFVYHYRMIQQSVTNLSKTAGVHNAALFDCLKKNAPDFFSIPKAIYEKLLEKRQRLAFRYLYTAAQQIHQLSKAPLGQILSSKEFLFSARSLTNNTDLVSRIVYSFWKMAGSKVIPS